MPLWQHRLGQKSANPGSCGKPIKRKKNRWHILQFLFSNFQIRSLSLRATIVIMKLHLQRLNDAFHYEVTNESGQSIQLDSSPDSGGHNLGMRPLETVIAALIGCSSIDVGMILQKGKQILRDYQVEARAERREEIPRIFTNIYLHFHLYGEIDPARAERAIKLSMEKYCSVTKILEPTANIYTEFTIHP